MHTYFYMIAIVATLAHLPSPVSAKDRFSGDVVARWLPDGRTMQLEKAFSFITKEGKKYTAPKGEKVDGASIPSALWTLVGPPFVGKYRSASVIHDYQCRKKDMPWREVHRLFHRMLLASDVGATRAKLLYAAVRQFGPRWGSDTNWIRWGDSRVTLISPGRCVVSYKYPKQKAGDLEALEKWINKNDASLEDIDKKTILWGGVDGRCRVKPNP